MMKKNKILLFVWAMLAALILLAISSLTESGTRLIGKSFMDTEEFKEEIRDFYNHIGPAVLNPIDVEEAKKEILVSLGEIEEHRDQYGDLPEQISNIYEQYEDRITDARDAGNKVLETTLVEERDKKVADIQKNFESDAHIEAKIRAEKAKEIERSLATVKNTEATNFPIAYKFTDIETGETFSAGNIKVPSAYKKEFNSKSGLFKANSVPLDNYDMEWFPDEYGSSWGWDGAVTEMETVENSDLTLYRQPARTFEGVVVVPKTALTNGFLSEKVKSFNQQKYVSYTLWVFAILAILVLFTKLKFRKEWVTETAFTERYDKLTVDVKAAVLFLSLFFTIEVIHSTAHLFSYYGWNSYTGIWTDRIGWFLALTIAIVLIAFQLVNLVVRWKHKGVFEQDFLDSYTIRFFKAFQDMFLKKTIGFQTFILLSGFFLAGIGLIGVLLAPVLIVAYIPAVLFLGLPMIYIFVRRSAYLNRIIVATEAMAEGRLQNEIAIEGKSPLAEHAKNLNNLREGVRNSMSEQAKSERLKTELITNVSHDLRTPLTSIITYTDLLKNEDLPVEDRAKYVDILDKKSQRLKTLIEDLFEVSKMASGNLELTKQRVDLTQLLQQALAEHSEEITERGLDFRVSFPESALVAHIDGKRWWRVLDNLIVNAIKYTLAGTRVYITLRKLGDNAEFVVKNITKYELGENTDELFERFKRADASRHTDGSGLGLAIAQSIVDMHDGNMKIEVDGDLFKVTVTVPIVY